jgi:HSP20 family protein
MIKHVGAAGLERLELQRLRDRVGRLFAALQEAMEADAPLASATWSPPVDLCESEKEINVRIELPGVAADQIKIGLTNSQLRVSGEKKRRVPRNRITSHLCSERSYGRFTRIVPLRWTISVREASAELSNGVLMVRLPKTTDRRGREFKIVVKDNNSS